MPKDAAPSKSDCKAMRLRSRQVNCKTVSVPCCCKRAASANDDKRILAPWLSVTFTAAIPVNFSTAANASLRSVPLGGAISAVTTNWPLSSCSDKNDISVRHLSGDSALVESADSSSLVARAGQRRPAVVDSLNARKSGSRHTQSRHQPHSDRPPCHHRDHSTSPWRRWSPDKSRQFH